MTPISSVFRPPKVSQTSILNPRFAGMLQRIDGSGTVIASKTIVCGRELVIGRDRSKCQLYIDDPCVSARHLRIYTITYDDNDPTDVDVLVYAEDLSRNGTYWNGSIIGRGRGSFLLSQDDVLKLSPSVQLVFKESNATNQCTHFDQLQEHELQKFANSYVVTDRLLGAGAFGKVFMTIDQTSRTQLACKVVDLRRLRPSVRIGKKDGPVPATEVDTRSLPQKVKEWAEKQRPENKLDEKIKTYYREAEILASIRHPNIIGLEKVFVTDNTIYLIQDLVTGGDLFSYIESKNGKLSEVEAAVIIRQIALAIAFLHDKNIVHRDLKPDNILMTELSTGCRVVLTDFGAARRINQPLSRMLSVAGTDEYAAPEVAQDTTSKTVGYTKAIDMWSLGCVATVLLTGASAFADPVTRLYSSVLARQCNLDSLRSSREWQAIRQRPKDFVEKLLTLSQEQRMTAHGALNHVWFSNDVHRSDFNELYQRAIKHWHPRPARNDLLQFLDAQYAKGIAQSEGIISGKRIRDPRSPRPSQIVEAHYKPFPRQMHIPIWPERRPYTGYVSPETTSAIRNCWPSAQNRPVLMTSPHSNKPSSRYSSKRWEAASFAEPTLTRVTSKRPATKNSKLTEDETPEKGFQRPEQRPIFTSPLHLTPPTWRQGASGKAAVTPLGPVDPNAQRSGDIVKAVVPADLKATAEVRQNHAPAPVGCPHEISSEGTQALSKLREPSLSEDRFDQISSSPSKAVRPDAPRFLSRGGLKRRSKTNFSSSRVLTPSEGPHLRRRNSVFDMDDTIRRDPKALDGPSTQQRSSEVGIAIHEDLTLPHHGSLFSDIDDTT